MAYTQHGVECKVLAVDEDAGTARIQYLDTGGRIDYPLGCLKGWIDEAKEAGLID